MKGAKTAKPHNSQNVVGIASLLGPRLITDLLLVWQRIRPELEARALTNKNQRLEREHAQLRMARRTLVSNRYDDYTRTLSPSQWKYLPRPLDICSFEPFRELITADPDITVTAQSFDEAFQMLPELLSSAAEERRNSKLALLPLVISDSVTDPLELATSAFYCQKCSKSSFYYSNILFGWNDIASHHCGVQTAGLFSSPSGNEVDNPGAYYMEAVTWVRKIAEKVGLDPATATVVEMDSKDVRFTCTTCPIQHMRGEWTRVGYCWRRLVHSPYNDHVNSRLTSHQGASCGGRRSSLLVSMCF